MIRRSRTKDAGFTLLEILISTVILVFISIFVARTINRGLEAKTKIQRDIDRTVALRETLSLMSRDIQLAFHYRDINVELYNAALAEGCKGTGTPPTDPPPPPPPPGTPPPPPKPARLSAEVCAAKKQQKIKTEFIGESEKLNFATLSNIRTQRDQQTSDQAEVGYELKDCRIAAAKSQSSSKCLWRRTSPVLDDKPLEGGASGVLLENVKSLSFRYLGPGENVEWVQTWRTDGEAGSAGTDSKTAGKFPLAVEITLEIEDRNVTPPKEIGMTIVAPIRDTNNPPPKTETDQVPELPQ